MRPQNCAVSRMVWIHRGQPYRKTSRRVPAGIRLRADLTLTNANDHEGDPLPENLDTVLDERVRPGWVRSSPLRFASMNGLASDLRALLPTGQVLDEPEHLLTYGFDGTAAMRGEATEVALPRTIEEVASVVRYAAERRVPIVTRGSGTGLSGGSVPSPGAIVLCLVHLDKLIELDERNLTALVECGVTTLTVAEAADAAGLLYPPDPGSMRISTIGGNVAENSGGLRGLKYGITRDYVMGMEVVLANGTIVWLGSKCVKDVAGYSMKDVFIGSEGTLGIITKVLLKLVPRPAAKRTMLASFATMDAAAETVSAIIAAKIIPCTLEF